MRPPDAFAARMHDEFDGMLRVRWSNASDTWHLEQKVGRGVMAPSRHPDPKSPGSLIPIEHDDTFIRARDGYALLGVICPGDRMPCPECRLPLRVPVMDFGEVRCQYCLGKGRDRHITAGYWPLGEALLEHLRRIDPRKGAALRLAREVDAANEHLRNSREKAARNEIRDATWDEAMHQIPKVGYTGPCNSDQP